MKITICACTFRRPEGLARLLASFRSIEVTDEMELEFLIVDNDVTPSARDVFEKGTCGFDWPCRYVHEPRPGIPSARNRVLEELRGGDYFAFVDDDEMVTSSWLVALLRVARRTGATFVHGPVEKRVADPRDRWWLQTLFFKQRSFPDGAERCEGWTNNVLVDTAFVKRHKCQFDTRMRFNSGEDTLFFQDIVRAGGTGAYAAEAWVIEVQGPERLTWGWVLRRQFNYGRTRALTMLLRKSLLASIALCLMRATALIAVSLWHFASVPFRGKVALADGIALALRAAAIILTVSLALFSNPALQLALPLPMHNPNPDAR